MLLWAKHKPLPEEVVNDIESTILTDCGGTLKYGFFTTYCREDRRIFSEERNKFLDTFYSDAITEMIKDMGINFGPRLQRGDSNSLDDYWVQMYNSQTTTHDVHDHFELCSEFHCLVSWVHVVKNIPDDLTSFYFKNHRGEKLCPVEQDTGMMFAFPSWARHGVQKIKVPDHNRIIIAGNIVYPTQKSTLTGNG